MFYSHEILTRREHGVATIWLVATLGSRSSLKRVTRKAINDVNVPKAVETIVTPDAPMALRLQGNLLYGVSRVYAQQANYVYTDLQNFWDKLRHNSTLFGAEGIEIDPEAGRARPEQLNLPDDPAFTADFDINLDLTLFDFPLERTFSNVPSQLPSLADSSRASLSDHETELELPSDETTGVGNHGFDFGTGTSSVGQFGSNIPATSIFEEPGIIDNPDFDIDADGNLFTHSQGQRQLNELAQDALSQLGMSGSKVGDSTGITDRVRAEHEAGQQDYFSGQALDYEDQGLFLGDDEPSLPVAAPFSARHDSSAVPGQHHQSSSGYPDQDASPIVEVAPQRRIRVKPAIKVDHETQLRGEVLKAWDTGYLNNMTTERRKLDHFTSTLPQAKKHAKHIVLGIGLSGLGKEFDNDLEHPLRQAFGGQAWYDLLTGQSSSPAGKKRDHASDDDEEIENARRVKPRGEEAQEVGRSEDNQYQFDDGDDIGIFAQGDDNLPIEVGRYAPPSITDIDSMRNSMPWNIHSTRTGSARPGLHSSTSIAGFATGFDPAFAPASSHRGQLASASPLFGRGQQGTSRYSSLEIPSLKQRSAVGTSSNDDDGGAFQLPDLEDDRDDEFELHGPAAGVSTQQADNSQWLATTLEDEANNFFAFLQAESEKRYAALLARKPESQALEDDHMDAAEWTDEHTVTFEKLLPLASNSSVVAAQGLLHVLTLATRGAVEVKQEQDFGKIEMTIVPGARLVERNDQEQRVEEMDQADMDARAAEGLVEEDEEYKEDDDDDDDEDMYG